MKIMKIIKYHLKDGEYVKTITKKDKIYLHHTAGSHRPDWTIDGWNSDKQGRVATSYLIGGQDIKDKDNSFNGKIYEAFEDKYWAYSLGIGKDEIEKTNIGIEICNYGQLTEKNGNFYNWVGSIVPDTQVIDLGFEFRGCRYFHNYTDNQLESLRTLLVKLSETHDIDLNLGLKEMLNAYQYSINPNITTLELQKFLNEHGFTDFRNKKLVEDGIFGNATKSAQEKCENDAFDFQTAAYLGQPGLWTHVNVRNSGKWDCYPHPKLIEMIKSL